MLNALTARARTEMEALRSDAHREYIAARARADAYVRLARLRGLDLETGQGLVFLAGRGPKFVGPGSFRLGERCRFRAGLMPSRVATGKGGRVVIGNRAGFNYGLELHASELVEIGPELTGGAMVTIYDTNFHPIEETTPTKVAPVRIGRNVWLGHHCTILPGVTIGDHAVIGSGAVVSRDVPPRTLMAGNPAKPVRELVAAPDWWRFDKVQLPKSE
jgi:acetyltransferase-like isoleucine patch superfamily enzyme